MTTGDRDMGWKPEDGERREHQPRGLSALEKSVIYLAQGAILIGVGWVISTVIDVKQSIVRIETRYEASVAASMRVDNELRSLRDRIQISDTTMQKHDFKIEDLERRIKGVELIKERLR